MKPTYSLSEIRSSLRESFSAIPETQRTGTVRMTGILLCPKGDSIAKKQILPSLDDFHHRSGDHIDFFCPGYTAGAYPDWKGVETVAETTDKTGHVTEWQYIAPAFESFRQELKEAAPRWAWSGEADLLLLNARPDGDMLYFSSSINLRLSQMLRDKVIGSVPELFEKIFSYAEAQDGRDPAWGFSDKMGVSVGASWLVRLIFSLLPKNVGDLWKQGRHYVCAELG